MNKMVFIKNHQSSLEFIYPRKQCVFQVMEKHAQQLIPAHLKTGEGVQSMLTASLFHLESAGAAVGKDIKGTDEHVFPSETVRQIMEAVVSVPCKFKVYIY